MSSVECGASSSSCTLICHAQLFRFQEKINDLKNSEMKLEEEKKHLKQVIEDGEKKIGMSESAKRILEGELYRMKMALNDKETEHQVMIKL